MISRLTVLLLLLLPSACGVPRPSFVLGTSEELCSFLADESAKDPGDPTIDVLCVDRPFHGRPPPPVAATLLALRDAAAVCDDGCSWWFHQSCEDLVWDPGYGPRPSCSVAVDCKMNWAHDACVQTIYGDSGSRDASLSLWPSN
jgi:hypothetical protein